MKHRSWRRTHSLQTYYNVLSYGCFISSHFVNTDGVICSMEHCNELLGACSLLKEIPKPMYRHAFWHMNYKSSKSSAETIISYSVSQTHTGSCLLFSPSTIILAFPSAETVLSSPELIWQKNNQAELSVPILLCQIRLMTVVIYLFTEKSLYRSLETTYQLTECGRTQDSREWRLCTVIATWLN